MEIEIGGVKIQVRGLTRGEIKTLRQEGMSITGINKLDDEAQDKALDRIFTMVSPDLKADSLTPGQGLHLYTKIIELSYAGEELKKKSESPQGSGLPEGGLIAGSVEKPGSSLKGTARKSQKRNG